MDSYEVVKTDQGHVMYVDGKYYAVPESAVRMNKEDLALIFEGVKSKPVAGVVTRSDVTANIIHTGNEVKITQQPAAVSVKAEDNASFAVKAEGDTPLFYQWKRNGLDVKGATDPTLTLNGVKQSDNDALYTCVVTNPAGSVTTTQARLTVG
jgi:hypothetical protein